MISAEEQKKVIALVKQTKELILKEMNNEENLLDSGSY